MENNQTMSLEEMMLQEGQFMTVANVKKGSLEDKIRTTKEPLKVKVLAEKVEKVKWDLRYKQYGDSGKFDFSEDFFNSIPTLANAGVGFSEFYIPSLNKTMLVLCEEDVENKFKVIPKFLNTKKGASKSLLFKAMSFEFYLEKSKLITKNPESAMLFSLTEEMPGVYGISPAEITVEVKADDMVVENSTVDNSPFISGPSVQNCETVNTEFVRVNSEDVAAVIASFEEDSLPFEKSDIENQNNVIVEVSNIPFTAENVATQQEANINAFEAAPAYNPSYMADQLDSFAESLAN